MPTDVERCPIPGCTRLRNGEMCKAHWYMVSRNTRNEVWVAYRAWSRDMADTDKFMAYRNASEKAKREAIDHE